MSPTTSNRDVATRRLRAPEAEIRTLGVERLAMFGSVLQDEARADTDGDVLVGFRPGEKTFARLLALSDRLEERLECSVESHYDRGRSPPIWGRGFLPRPGVSSSRVTTFATRS